MVDLVKIRKKAKKDGAPAIPPAPAGKIAGAPPEDKLAKFFADAGRKRPGFMREVAAETPGDRIEMLTFTIGSEQYAIDIDRIAEIITPRPLTRVPNADPRVVGIVSLRGAVVTLINVREALHQQGSGGAEDVRIIVIQDGTGLIGFEVDRVLRVSDIERSAIEPHPVVHPSEQDEAIRGVVKQAGALTILLDLDKLLA